VGFPEDRKARPCGRFEGKRITGEEPLLGRMIFARILGLSPYLCPGGRPNEWFTQLPLPRLEGT
jgi:hypothetical protein